MASEKSKLLQPGPTPYQEPSQHPNAGYSPSVYPSTSGYQGQQYGAAVGPYNQGSYPRHPTITIQPTLCVNPVQLAYAPPDYMGYSIFTMLCCCFPLGIAALVYSCATREANMSGDRDKAVNGSTMAYILNNIALGIGLGLIMFGFILAIEQSDKSHSFP